jgi:hypothetical protein
VILQALRGILLVTALLAAATTGTAAVYTLTNAPGDGTVTVGVDGFGAFGSSVGSDSTDADYDPVGAGTTAGTTFESGVAIRVGSSGGRTFLTSGSIGGSPSPALTNPTVMGTSTVGTSTFAHSGLSFGLTQTLTPLFVGATQTGSLLTDTYVITNPSGAAIDFELVRYLDGDLLFDGSLVDGGGRLISGGTEVLFETDSATGSSSSTTFVGITATGGTIPATDRFEIDSWSGLLARIIAGTALDDTITGDGGDADEFIDAGSGYDVTLALRNLFSLGALASATYETRTIFGSGAPEDIPVGGEVPELSSFATWAGLVAFGLICARIRKRRLAA